MNKIIAGTIIVFVCAALYGAEREITFTALDGTLYSNAIVERICPNGIDIGYRKKDGTYAIKFISYKDMPENLRTESGIDDAAAVKFDKEIQDSKLKDMDSIAEEQQKKLSELIERIKKKIAGGDVDISADELSSAVYAHRFAGQLTSIEKNKAGCVANVVKVTEGEAPKNNILQLDSCSLPSSGIWSGFLYPTGLKAKYEGKEIPVYTDDPDKAANLLAHYLGIYSTYALDINEKPQPETPPQQPEPEKVTDNSTTPQTPPQDNSTTPQTTVNNYYYYGNTDGGYGTGTYYGTYYGGYSIGGYYTPVYWFNINRHDRHDRPDKPDRPDRPDKPDKPDKPQKPVPSIGRGPSKTPTPPPVIHTGPFDSPFTTVKKQQPAPPKQPPRTIKTTPAPTPPPQDPSGTRGIGTSPQTPENQTTIRVKPVSVKRGIIRK